MSYRSHTAAPSRVFDHLYDPLFTTSDRKNVYKENCIALTRSAPIHIYPVYRSMFSELNHEQRNCYAYQKNILPHFTFEKTHASTSFSVTGADRSKFFSNPMNNIRTINVGLMAEESLESVEETQVVKYRTACIQTKFRESSAQTRPWLPEIICSANENLEDEMPEVVYHDMIDSVTYPGLREVEIIERARKRRSWEMALPPIKVAEEIPSRVIAVEVFEWEEWIAREKDINECQQARLKIVADLIAKREKKHQDTTNQKLENCRKRILTERKQQKDILIRNYQRNMRKLDLAQRKGSNRGKTNDPVLSHYDKKMEYSLPKIRLDAISKKRTQIEYTSEFEKKFNLMEQDNSALGDLQKYLKTNKRDLWLPKEYPTKEVERGIWSENYLKKLHETLKQFRRKKYAKRKLPICLVYDESASTAESSMSGLFQPPDDEIDEIHQNTVNIQKNVKGRAIQSMLKKGMDKFRDVIEEAKETHSIAAIRKLFPKEFSQQIDNQDQILDEYKRIEEALKNDEKLQEELKMVECRDSSNLLNFLEKELHRLEGEKRAHAMFLLAERERYSRQAVEMGKTEFEEQFRNDAITLYLENVLCEGVHRAADDNNCEFIRRVAKQIDRKASKTVTFDEEVEQFSDESNTEDVSDNSLRIDEIPDQKVVMELLKENMMPQIMDRIKNEHQIVQQKKYLSAAHKDLFREEYEHTKLKQERQVCSDILYDMIELATAGITSSVESNASCDSKEAEVLASQTVEQILNEIVEANFEFSSSSTGHSSSTGSYDGDFSNVPSTSDADSTTELANQVVRSILNEILENSSSSTTDFTETQTSDTN